MLIGFVFSVPIFYSLAWGCLDRSHLSSQSSRLGVGVAIGVGGSFDVLAGLRARAPLWMQRLGMEWFYRLVQEPRRLLARYLVTNSQFVWLVLVALVCRDRNP